MNILSRYLGTTVLRSVLLVLLVLLALDAVSDILDQTGELRGDYNLGAALLYVILKIPGSAVDYLGFAALIGCLIGIGGLSNSSELTVMRAAGVSARQILFMVLKPTLVIIVAGALVAEFVAPGLEQIAQSRKDLLRGTVSAQQAEGTWVRDGEDFLHVNSVYPDGILFGVSHFRMFQGELEFMRFAERVTFDGEIWHEQQVRETLFGEGYTDTAIFAQRVWDTGLTPDILKMASLRPEQLSVRDLLTFSEYLGSETKIAATYQVALWTKIFQPLAIAALVLIGLSFVYGASRSVPMSQRIFAGIVVAVVFKLAQDILGPASTIWGFSPAIAVAIPILITLSCGAWLLKKQS